MKNYRLGAVALVICGAAAAATAADTTYPIKMDRPFKAGDAYNVHITVEGSTHDSRLEQGQSPMARDNVFQGDLTGRIDIAAVDEHNNETAFSITVGKLTSGTLGKEVVEPGKVIDVKRTTKDITFTLRGGGEPGDEAKAILSRIYDRINASGISDDQACGTKTPRKTGESWPLDSAAEAKQISGMGLDVDPANVSGQTTLMGVERVDGKDALRLVTSITVNKARPAQIPENVTVQSSELKSQTSALFPVDASLPPVEVDNTQDSSFVYVRTFPPMRVDSTGHQHTKIKITPIAK